MSQRCVLTVTSVDSAPNNIITAGVLLCLGVPTVMQEYNMTLDFVGFPH